MSDKQNKSIKEIIKSDKYSPEVQKAFECFLENRCIIMEKDISFKSSLKRKINRLKKKLI